MALARGVSSRIQARGDKVDGGESAGHHGGASQGRWPWLRSTTSGGCSLAATKLARERAERERRERGKRRGLLDIIVAWRGARGGPKRSSASRWRSSPPAC